MTWLTTTIIEATSAFAATNVDDIAILMLLFSQVNETFRIRHIVLGQYLGFTTILIASLPGYFGGLIVERKWIGLLGFLPIAIGFNQLFHSGEDEPQSIILPSRVNKQGLINRLTSFISPQTYGVAALTLANGGDNIGIYVPLFANNNLPGLVIILAVFYTMIAVWCYTAYLLTRHPVVANLLTRYGKRFVPFILIALGLFILIESKTYKLIPFFS